MKTRIVFIALASLLATPLMAQPKADPPAAQSPTAAMTEGEIRKVDKEAKKLTIRHAEIRNLDMPPMTMVFQVSDVALLDRLKAGDRILFSAEKAASGYVVTDVRMLP